MMKKICIFLTTIALCGCSNGIPYTVTGNLGTGHDSVYLITSGGKGTVLASGPVAKDGTFQLRGQTVQPTVAELSDGKNALAMLFLEKGDLLVAPSQTGGYNISGTISNDGLAALNHSLGEIQTEFYTLGPGTTDQTYQALYAQYNKIISDCVTANRDNLLGAFFFATKESAEMEIDEARRRLAQFSEQMQRTELLTGIARTLDATAKTENGQPFIELELPNADGQRIALSQLTGQGKWVLIDFWATWCDPCRGEIPYLKEAYALYNEKGFTIYGVSLDNDTEAWRSFIADNELPWTNVLAVEKGQSPASELYGVRTIPTNFLIGPDGRIAAKNLRGDALMTELKERIE